MTRKRILLVEDNPDDVEFLQLAFERTESRPTLEVFRDAQGALARLADASPEGLPDLIVMDLSLPGLTGHEFLTELGARMPTREIPVIVLTTSRCPRDRQRSLALRANAHVTKPCDFREYERLAESIDSFWLRWAQPVSAFEAA